MASHSEDAAADYGGTNSRIGHAAGEMSRAQGPRGRVSSVDVTHCGGHFVEGGHDEDVGEYPTHLEISGEEDHDRQPHSDYQYGQLPEHRSLSRDGNPSPAPRASSTSNSRTPTLTRAHLLPYLQPGDLQRLGHQSTKRRSRSRRTRGFARHMSTSSSVSGVAYATSTSTTTTYSASHDRHGNDNDNDRGYTPYFSPSHTPSHRSMATDEDVGEEAKTPTSPLPYSTYHTYDPRYARDMLDEFEHRINER